MRVPTTQHSLARWTAVALAALALTSCGGDDTGGEQEELRSVGSACSMASQCESPTTAACLTELKPMKAVAGVPEGIAMLGLSFPQGYCSSAPNCASDADCGSKGACYRPFRAVTAETLRALEKPLMLAEGAMSFLPTYGVCLRTCPNNVVDCEAGQKCEKPLAEFVGLVTGSINDVNFCIPM